MWPLCRSAGQLYAEGRDEDVDHADDDDDNHHGVVEALGGGALWVGLGGAEAEHYHHAGGYQLGGHRSGEID